jgi:hydrogenase maturation factor
MTTVGALPQRLNLDLYQGDDFALTVNVNDLSLVGAVAAAQVRQNPGSPILAAFLVTVDETAGTIDLLLTAGDTELLPTGGAVWDLQVTAAGMVRTLLAGAVKIAAEVTL